MVKGLRGGELDLQNGVAEPSELGDHGGDAGSGAGGGEKEVCLRAAEAGQKVTLRDEGGF